MNSKKSELKFPTRAVPHTRIKDQSALEEEYEVGETLGKGSFGEVKLVTHKETGKRWAMKMLDKSKAGSNAVKQLEKEVSILKRVNHPHIVLLKQVMETPKQMYLIMELCDGGEMHDVLAKKHHYSEADTRVIITRLNSACHYLHSNDITHRDLKLDNILMSTENADDTVNIKVSDFGLSTMAGEMMQDMCGTPLYMAPEVINNLGYGLGVDIWSMGIIMYYCLCGNPPFISKKEDELYDLIRKGDVTFAEPEWKNVSEAAKGLVEGMLKVNPAERMTAREIMDHPWITGDTDAPMPTVLEMMKSYNAERRFKRAGWAVVAAHKWLTFALGTGVNDEATPGGGERKEPHPCNLECPCWEEAKRAKEAAEAAELAAELAAAKKKAKGRGSQAQGLGQGQANGGPSRDAGSALPPLDGERRTSLVSLGGKSGSRLKLESSVEGEAGSEAGAAADKAQLPRGSKASPRKSTLNKGSTASLAGGGGGGQRGAKAAASNGSTGSRISLHKAGSRISSVSASANSSASSTPNGTRRGSTLSMQSGGNGKGKKK